MFSEDGQSSRTRRGVT